jgi:hypothetical protein
METCCEDQTTGLHSCCKPPGGGTVDESDEVKNVAEQLFGKDAASQLTAEVSEEQRQRIIQEYEVRKAQSIDDEGFDLLFGQHKVAKFEPMEKELLAKTLEAVRQEYATAKLQYQLRLRNHPALVKQAHPGNIEKQVAALEACLEYLEELVAAGGEIPGPSKLEVVTTELEVPDPCDDPSAA